MSGRGGNRIETFTIPERKRAVVLHIALGFWTSINQSAFVVVHGIPLYYKFAPVADQFYMAPVRFTAYAGETILVNLFGTDVSYGVDGFLLDDDAGRPDDADNVITPHGGQRPELLPGARA